ncbi:multicopper oxidase-domain-containing protein [Ampelomyces quisqualis]|uniref:Multicopper oxidase-domain-containing protein n=1 Tax=Ampelomyces quisqualis TaxID=50730 RepID=A0A6A5QI80_AMPQU|nr:multicopper oxidase-domain-containing protein [Ampelomyces quisqualis]
MVFTIGKAAALVALLCTLITALPSIEALKPRVAWKENGLSDHQKRQNGSPTDGECTHGPSSRGCWHGDFNIDTDMDEHWPNTGKVVTYHLDITNDTMAPDGFSRPVMVVNGQLPGPTIVADWGDILEITVTSHLTANGTGIHWHGMRQLGTNQMDGVNGITECPIAPGETRFFRFQATQYGTTWYHSHYSVQYGDGLWGTIIINGPSTANYDIDLGTLPITDWFHATSFTVNAATLHAKGPPTSDNILVNGSMTSSSGGKYAETTLTPGKSHLLRIVNVGINNWNHVGLDGHKFTVVAADFTPIVPYQADSINVAVGQRYDVIITANSTVSNYWLRVGTGGRCDGPNSNAANIRSIFRYAGAGSAEPNSTAATPLPTGCYDEQVVPYVKTTVPQNTPDRLSLGFTDTAGSGDLVQWLVNDVPMLVDLGYPTLQHVVDGNDTFAKARNVFKVGEKHKWQYWVIQQSAAAPPVPHPIHLHGHDFYILDQQASTPWSGDISRLKTDNPVRRDTATLPGGGYLVLAFESDNPGAWLMHCHIPFHVSAGLGIQFLERMDEIDASGGMLEGGCKSWKAWEDDFVGKRNGSILIGGDSGL